jgi:isocitrate dehydrogenase (NAD+)
MELTEQANRVEKALHTVFAGRKVRTGDLGGSATTREFTDALIAAL